MESEFRFKSFKRKFSSATYVYNLMIGCPEKNKENCPKKALEQRNKKPRLNFKAKFVLRWGFEQLDPGRQIPSTLYCAQKS